MLVEPLRGASCAHPRLHAVWAALLAQLAPLPSDGAAVQTGVGADGGPTLPPSLAFDASGLRALWSAVIDEGLMTSPSAERKYARRTRMRRLCARCVRMSTPVRVTCPPTRALTAQTPTCCAAARPHLPASSSHCRSAPAAASSSPPPLMSPHTGPPRHAATLPRPVDAIVRAQVPVSYTI